MELNVLFEDNTKKVFMNSSGEVFVENKNDGTQLRISVPIQTGGISVTFGNANIKVGSANGLGLIQFKGK